MKHLNIVFIILMQVIPAVSADFDFSIQAGYLHLTDSVVKSAYGSGFFVRPALSLGFSPYFSLNAGYENGYRQSTEIGLYKETSTLYLNAWEFSCALRCPFWDRFVPFVEAGLGSYEYRQDIDSGFIRRQVNHQKISSFAAAGVTFFLGNSIFLSAGFKVVPLKVRPFDVEVDLTGYRVLAGIGYRFSFK
jgi:hypothetical protein